METNFLRSIDAPEDVSSGMFPLAIRRPSELMKTDGLALEVVAASMF